jgi:nitrate reductase gamma subunit
MSEPSNSPRSTLSKGALAGIVLGTIAGAVTLSAVVTLLILRVHMKKHPTVSRRRRCEYLMFMILGRLDRCVMIFDCACNCFLFYTLVMPVDWAKLSLRYKGLSLAPNGQYLSPV